MATLTIHPTSIAQRQWQKQSLRATPFLDTRHHIALSGFFGACTDAAMRAGLLASPDGAPLRPMDDLEQEVAIMQTVSRFLNGSDSSAGILSRLPALALEDILAELERFLDPLAAQVGAFLDRVETLNPAAGSKNRELARLHRCLDETCLTMGLATTTRVNASILAVLADRQAWPECLQDVSQVRFVGQRWAPPFVDRVASVLSQHLGADNVHQVFILQEHEHDFWGRQLMARSGTILFAGESDTGDPMDRFVDLREGLAVRDSELAASARHRVGFSHSVGTYGEIEDIARRIVHHMKTGVRADEICLTARNLGEYSDPIIDVFSRFGIPHYFRRGIPLLSTPLIKTVMDLLQFSVSHERDTFCALLESPWLDWTNLPDADPSDPPDTSRLANDIRRAGVEPRITLDLLESRLAAFHAESRQPAASERLVAAARRTFQAAAGRGHVSSLSHTVADLQARLRLFHVLDRLRSFADSSADNPDAAGAYVLNARAFQAFSTLLERLETAPHPTGSDTFTWPDMHSIVSRALNNMTVSDPQSTDSGVWIMSPYDVAGLRFRLVIVAGLNSGGFPIIPRQSAVFHDEELEAARHELGGSLPDTALATSAIRNSQENLLFLSLLTAATDRLVLSRISRDENGEEVTPSIFYTMLWRLVGWPAFGRELPDSPPDSYDAWRLHIVPDLFAAHWDKQKRLDPHHRNPFPGESYLGAIPAPLCCAVDEARQSIMAGQHFAEPGRHPKGAPDPVACNVEAASSIEATRLAFFDAQSTGRAPAVFDEKTAPYVGVISSDIWKLILPGTGRGDPDFTPTELATVATCPYRYYLQRILNLEEVQTNDLEAAAADRGNILHAILNAGFRLLRGDRDNLHGVTPATRKRFSALCRPSFAVKRPGGWALETTAPKTDVDALPVIIFDAERLDDYQELFSAIVDGFENDFRSGACTWMLGAREQAGVEWRKIRRHIHNLVGFQFTHVMNTGLTEATPEIVRCTALLEHVFSSRTRQPNASPSIAIVNPATGERFHMHGKIDRVDLLFNKRAHSRLAAVSVIDYKGTAGKTALKRIQTNIANAVDCQPPAYILAAADRLFGGRPPDDVPIRFHYLSYSSNVDDLEKHYEKNGIDIDASIEVPDAEGTPMESRLLDVWQHKVFDCLGILRDGRFVVQSSDCEYCPFRAICRYSESPLHGEEEGEP